jgi:hypothetical protein
MDFVDQIDLVAPPGGHVLDVIEQFPGIVNARPRGRIDLDQINEAPLVDRNASPALTAGFGRYAGLAIQCFGEDPRDRRLANPTRSGKQVGMMQAASRQRIGQRPDDVRLPHERLEAPRPPFDC